MSENHAIKYGQTYRRQYIGGEVTLCAAHAADDAASRELRTELGLGDPGAVQDARMRPCEACGALEPRCMCRAALEHHETEAWSERGDCPRCGLLRAASGGRVAL